MRSFAILILHLVVACKVAARTWTDIIPFHHLTPLDLDIGSNLFEHDPFHFTLMPSQRPSKSPSALPSSSPLHKPSLSPSISPSLSTKPTVTRSLNPSVSPSSHPTDRPSTLPTDQPSKNPTSSPTSSPTKSPTPSPTIEEYPENDLPDIIPADYFNYDTSRDATYGPGFSDLVVHNATMLKFIFRNNGWENVTNGNETNFYWREFDAKGVGPWAGVLANRELQKNMCKNVGKQSPIDIRDSGAECFEHHQIRTRRGDMTIGSDMIEPRIESSKLRLYFKRRPCPNITALACTEPDPPHGDFPNNWGGYADVIHMDFKVPSEHTIYGERFDAEMQIFHLHPSRRRTPTVSVVIRANRGGYNPIFQDILDKFQHVFNDHGAQCAASIRREQRRTTKVRKVLGTNARNEPDYDTWEDFSTYHDDPSLNATLGRRTTENAFNPYHDMLVPSLYFFGYEGSITEPPCSEFVSWFVTDTPMEIGLTQLEQMKRLLFEHVSPTCEKTSVHSSGSVARPIQDSFGRDVWRCTPKDFLADAVRFVDDDIV